MKYSDAHGKNVVVNLGTGGKITSSVALINILNKQAGRIVELEGELKTSNGKSDELLCASITLHKNSQLKSKRIAELEHQVARLKDFINPAPDALDPERHER